MKTGIHPEYKEAKVHCSCGTTFSTHSTMDKINVEICSKCHPFYTGKQKFIDSGGRVEKFQKKFEAARKNIEAKVQKAEALKKKEQEKVAASQQSAVSEQSSEEKQNADRGPDNAKASTGKQLTRQRQGFDGQAVDGGKDEVKTEQQAEESKATEDIKKEQSEEQSSEEKSEHKNSSKTKKSEGTNEES